MRFFVACMFYIIFWLNSRKRFCGHEHDREYGINIDALS